MSARWMLDVAALLQATRVAAQTHAALRGQQIALYARTSSLTATTQGVARNPVESVRQVAAAQLTSNNAQDIPADEPTVIPSADHAQGSNSSTKTVGQDHHYDAAISHSAIDTKPNGSLKVAQERSSTRPQVDGSLTRPSLKDARYASQAAPSSPNLSSEAAKWAQRTAEAQIPGQVAKGPEAEDNANGGFEIGQEQDVFHTPSRSTTSTLSSLPRVKLPKEASTAQGGIEPVSAGDINPDVFYSPKVVGSADSEFSTRGPDTFDEQNAKSLQETYLQVVQTPRVAKILQGAQPERSNPYGSKQSGIRKSQEWPPKERSTATGAEAELDVQRLAQDISSAAELEQKSQHAAMGGELMPFQMRESRVPSSRFGRLWQYAGLGASMTVGAAAEGFRRLAGSQPQAGESIMLSGANLERLVAKLSRMRGAALKLGQMLSFQDSKLLPPTIHQVLQRVQDSADYMPASQRNQVLQESLGVDWRDLFSSFDEQPLAAASIGQVHGAVMKSTSQRVVVKIQYPGVADSISSDLNNLSVLLTATRLLPKGLYLDKTIANARTELAWECNYIREAEAAKRFQNILRDEEDVFVVPKIHEIASGRQVLTMQRMDGVAVTKIPNLSQEQKDWIGTQILRLCLREITEFKFMQTDPNWTNFLFNSQTGKLELLDFGASREFSDDFIQPYTQILSAASKDDREACRRLSIQLGYLTGMESKAMLDAHIASISTLAEPFKGSSPDIYDFRDQTITDRVRTYIPVMLRERLAPPPEETYSLHRKLSGAFLLLARLGSRVRCKDMFATAIQRFEQRHGA